MRIISLQSGSNGNCVYIESGGTRLLVDAGISGEKAEKRLAKYRIDIRSVQAVLVTHDHRDHIGSAGIFQRKFGIPLWGTQQTFEQAMGRWPLGKIEDVRYFRAGESFRLGDLRIETVPTPHDATEGVGFVIDDGRSRFGVLTDLGHVFPGLADQLASLDAVLLESNYDPKMLRDGSYPYPLQQRILGSGGHLSNEEAAKLLQTAGERLRWACLGHISAENNSHELVLRTHRKILGPKFKLMLASRDEASPAWDV